MYESWASVAKALGFFKEPLSEAQLLAQQLENPDPHDRLATALKVGLDAHARSAGREITRTTRTNKALVAKLELMGVSLSLDEEFGKARKRALLLAMRSSGVTPLPTVDAFVKWMRRRAAE
jgi:hypothetical protein